ncbi:MAG: MBL fold metallo-hydrolase [Bacilli bacterium]|nr:MBL fold metallo-hydrolase [Bacilli bacterium]
MKLTFIGTGNMGSTSRANTSIIVDNILFDCGMGTIKQLERLGKKVKDLDCLVISHFHADHFFDIPN